MVTMLGCLLIVAICEAVPVNDMKNGEVESTMEAHADQHCSKNLAGSASIFTLSFTECLSDITICTFTLTVYIGITLGQETNFMTF